jgi:hypothetical protein
MRLRALYKKTDCTFCKVSDSLYFLTLLFLVIYRLIVGH